MTRLAPVSVTVYDRLRHLQACVSALLSNPEAPQTVLYVFSDAARPGHEAQIEAVRDYVRQIDGFAEVRPHFQKENCFLRNMHEAREIPLNDFGCVIRMEDDVVVSPAFLRYMNTALDLYRNDKRIFAISGYSPQFETQLENRVFLSKDFSAWGFATWADRQISQCVARSDYHSAMRRAPAARLAAQRLHPFMLPMLQLIEQGKFSPGDYKLSAHQFLTGTYSVKPVPSLVKNAGFDGSGMGGSGAQTTTFDTSIGHICPEMTADVAYDPKTDEDLFGALFPLGPAKTRRTMLKLWISARLPSRMYFALKKLRAIAGTR